MAFTQKQGGEVDGGAFSAFRENGAPTYYGEANTPVTVDVVESGIIFAGCIMALAFLAIIPGFKGVSKFYTFLWIAIGMYVGTLIVVSQYSDSWETAEVEAYTKYKAGTGEGIKAKIGLHIGLKGVNVTLRGEPVHQLNETINYNEHFDFATRQGRLGFGPFANNLNREFRAAQFRGLPLPLLWVAEYFTIDGEGIRWGRLYRESGLYAGISLWFSLGFWILANILVFILLRYAAYMCIMTGLTMGTAVVIKHYLRNVSDLVIPFSAEHKLDVHYGIMFWLILGTGALCVVCGALVFLVDYCCPHLAAAFFGVNVLQEEGFRRNKNSALIGEPSDLDGVVVVRPVADRPVEDRPVVDRNVVEVDRHVEDRQVAPRPRVKPNRSQVSPEPFSSNTNGASLKLDADWTGESCDWEDCSEDKDNTDDEYDDGTAIQKTRRKQPPRPRKTVSNIKTRQAWQSKKGKL